MKKNIFFMKGNIFFHEKKLMRGTFLLPNGSVENGI